MLGAADRGIGLTRRFAACFKDSRNSNFIEHSVQTLVTQRIVGIALGYEDLIAFCVDRECLAFQLIAAEVGD